MPLQEWRFLRKANLLRLTVEVLDAEGGSEGGKMHMYVEGCEGGMIWIVP